MHTLVLKGDIMLPQSVRTLLSIQGRSLTCLHHIIKPKTFLYLGMKPRNWQGCCKLFLGGGNNHHLEDSPSQIYSPLAAQDSPVMDSLLHVLLGFCRSLVKELQGLSKTLISHQIQACMP